MALHYLVDGYNLLYAFPEIPTGNLQDKRDAVLKRLAQTAPQGNNALTVVFDGSGGGGSRVRRAGIDVVFTAGESADDWLARFVRETRHPRTCVVVTDDKGIRHMIRGTGAKWLSAQEFLQRAGRAVSRRQAPNEDLDDITDELRREWDL